MATDNKALVRRVFEEIWNQNRLESANEVFDTNYVEHDPATPDAGRGVASFRRMYDTYHTAFPDTRFTVDDIVAEGDHVAVRWTVHGTHRGELRGISPTNKRVTVTGTSFYHVSNGKIQECWDNWDALGLMRQIGAIHEPAART